MTIKKIEKTIEQLQKIVAAVNLEKELSSEARAVVISCINNAVYKLEKELQSKPRRIYED